MTGSAGERLEVEKDVCVCVYTNKKAMAVSGFEMEMAVASKDW